MLQNNDVHGVINMMLIYFEAAVEEGLRVRSYAVLLSGQGGRKVYPSLGHVIPGLPN